MKNRYTNHARKRSSQKIKNHQTSDPKMSQKSSIVSKYLEKIHLKIDAKKGGRKVKEGGVYTQSVPSPPSLGYPSQ